MQQPISIWTLKKQPLADVASYIAQSGTLPFQATMAGMPLAEFEALPAEARKERLIDAIASMTDEAYSEYLLELIDE